MARQPVFGVLCCENINPLSFRFELGVREFHTLKHLNPHCSNTYKLVVFEGKQVGIAVSDFELHLYSRKPLLDQHEHGEHAGQEATKTTSTYQSILFRKKPQLETQPKFRLPAAKVAPIKTKIRTLRNAMTQKTPMIYTQMPGVRG